MMVQLRTPWRSTPADPLKSQCKHQRLDPTRKSKKKQERQAPDLFGNPPKILGFLPLPPRLLKFASVRVQARIRRLTSVFKRYNPNP